MKENKMNYVLVAVCFLSLGLVMGFLLQQAMTQGTIVKVMESMEGVNITIDLNETKIVDYTLEKIHTELNYTGGK
jgi:hypothetical protein